MCAKITTTIFLFFSFQTCYFSVLIKKEFPKRKKKIAPQTCVYIITIIFCVVLFFVFFFFHSSSFRPKINWVIFRLCLSFSVYMSRCCCCLIRTHKFYGLVNGCGFVVLFCWVSIISINWSILVGNISFFSLSLTFFEHFNQTVKRLFFWFIIINFFKIKIFF